MYDFFISHAGEDKEQIARPLAEALIQKKYNVWFDEFSIQVGDSLFENINYGLLNSECMIVILSKHFINKEWPQKELNAMFNQKIVNQKRIIPILYKVSQQEITSFFPILADIASIASEKGIDYIIEKIVQVFENKVKTKSDHKVKTKIKKSNLSKSPLIRGKLSKGVLKHVR